MTTNSIRSRSTAAGVALLAGLTLGACGDNSRDDVTNDPVDDSSETTPGEGDQGGEDDN